MKKSKIDKIVDEFTKRTDSFLSKNEQTTVLNPEDYKYFSFIESVEINDEDNYFLVCSNVNHDDTWTWKWADSAQNWTPVWSTGYGDCKVKGKDLHKVMENANMWLAGICARHDDKSFYELKKLGIILPVGYIMKI